MRTVLVTGAAGGLGSAMVDFLAGEGCTVLATDIKPFDDQEYPNSTQVHRFHLDVTSEESLDQTYQAISSQFNGLDGLVNNAGVPLFGPTVETDLQTLRNLLEVNFIGPQLVTKTFFPLLLQKGGRVINISSESIKYLAPFCLYPMSKRCLETWHEVLRQDLGLLGMKAILIRPGAHETPLVRQFRIKSIPQTSFRNEIDSFHRQAEKGTKNIHNPLDVARVVFKALTASNPSRVYQVNNNPLLTLLGWLPGSARDRLNHFLLKTRAVS